VEITFEQNEDRDDTSVNVSVVSKLAPVKPIATRMSIGRNLATGEVFAEEYGNQIKGQMSFADLEQKQSPNTVIGKDVVDTATGEVIGTKDDVIDFRSKAAE